MNVDGDDALEPKDGSNPPDSPLVWDPAPLRLSPTAIATIQTQPLPQGAPIPSPLATLGRRQAELTAVANETVASVRDLWHLCANTSHASGDNHIRHEIASGRLRKKGSQHLDDANVGFVAWIERASILKQDEVQTSSDESSDDDVTPATDTLRHRWVFRANQNFL